MSTEAEGYSGLEVTGSNEVDSDSVAASELLLYALSGLVRAERGKGREKQVQDRTVCPLVPIRCCLYLSSIDHMMTLAGTCMSCVRVLTPTHPSSWGSNSRAMVRFSLLLTFLSACFTRSLMPPHPWELH